MKIYYSINNDMLLLVEQTGEKSMKLISDGLIWYLHGYSISWLEDTTVYEFIGDL